MNGGRLGRVQAGHRPGGGQGVGDGSRQCVAKTEPGTSLVVVDVPHRLARPIAHPAILHEVSDTDR
jgi:hypothetical protein